MSNESEIGKEMSKEGKLVGTSDTSQNKVQVEQIAKDFSMTVLGVSSSTSGNSIEVLENTQSSIIGKNTESSKDLSEKYRLIALNTSDLIAFTTFDVEPIFTFVSPSHKKILGFEADDLIGKSGLDFIHEDDKQNIMTLLLAYIDAKINDVLTADMVENAPKLDFRFRDKSGQWHFLHSTVDIVNNELLFISKDITEQKRSELKLRDDEQKMHAIIQGLSIAAFVLGCDHKVIYWNKALEELSNICAKEVIGTSNHWRAFYNEKRPCMADILIDGRMEEVNKWYAGKFIKSSLLDESFEAIDFFPNLGNDGKWLRFAATVIRNTSGDLVGVLETLEDISKRKIAEIALQESEERFRLAISSITDILYEWDIKTGSMQWFGDIDSRLGYENGTFPRTIKDFLKHVHSEDINNIQTIATNGLKSHQKWQGTYRVINKDGAELYWYGTGIGIYDPAGNPIKVVGAVTDITERKRVEEELRIKDSAISSSFNAIAISDLNGNLIYVNDAFSRMWGYTLQDKLNINVADLDSNKDEIIHIINDIKEKGFCNGESVAIRNDGSLFDIQYSASLVTNSLGKPIAMLSTFIDITERKRAEDTRRQSEEKYRLVTENASDTIWTIDLNLQFTYVSPSNEKMTGYTTEKALKLSLDKLLTPESMERALQTFTSEMQLENSEEKDLFRSVTLELNEIKADGTIFPIEVRMSILRDAHDNPIGILGITRDITERKKQQEILKKSEEKFIKAFKSSPVAICITRISDGKFIEINESLEKLSGYSRAELLAGSSIGLNLWVDNEDRKQVAEQLAKNGSVHDREYRFRIKGGSEIVVRYSAEVIDFSDERCCLSVIIDITERKKMEESLRDSEEKYRSIVENTQDVIMLTNPEGRISYLSPACISVLGYNPNDLVGKILEIYYPDDVEKVRTAHSNALRAASGSNLEYRILTKNGETRWVSHSWSPILTENHELQCIVSVIRDITESKMAEQMLKEKIEELEKYKNVTVNRELKMIELKKQLDELKAKSGEKT